MQTLEDIEEWRKYGPIGKLHNIVVDIQSSPQKIQEFMNMSRKMRPSRDNKTRWGSMAQNGANDQESYYLSSI
jgi:hypothetical protein